MIKDLEGRNVCVIEQCETRTTPEGLCCRYHWSRVPGPIKEWYQRSRIMAIKAVKAWEEVP